MNHEEWSSELIKEAGPKDWLLPLSLIPGVVAPSVPSGADTPKVQYEAPAVGWQHYEHLIGPAASRHNVPLDMFRRLLHTENTSGNPKAVNPSSGAVGLAQFMPSTAAELGIDPKNPKASIDASARYLRNLFNQFSSWELAVKAYNWGPGSVERQMAEGGDTPRETEDYLDKVQPPVL